MCVCACSKWGIRKLDTVFWHFFSDITFFLFSPQKPDSSVQFNSHLFFSPIGARTLKMPVPYSTWLFFFFFLKTGHETRHDAGCRTILTGPWFWEDFQNARNFQKNSSNVGVIQVFSPYWGKSYRLNETKELSKIPRFLGGYKWGLYFSWFLFEKSCSNFVNQYFSLGEKYWLTKDWSGGFMTLFRSTSKADFCILTIPCVLKIFSKPRLHKNSPATSVKSDIISCPLFKKKK